MRQDVRVLLRQGTATAHRSFSSSPAPSFFFSRPAKPTTPRILSDINAACTQDRLDLVAKLYPSLVESLQSPSSSTQKRPAVDAQDIHRLLRFIANTNHFPLLLRIFTDFPLFGLNATVRDHQAVLIGLSRAGKPSKALKWLESMKPTYGILPRTSEWNVVLDAFKRQNDWTGLEQAFRLMQAAEYSPDTATFNTLLAADFQRGDLTAVRATLDKMEAHGIERNVRTDSTLLSGFVKMGDLESAKTVRDRLLPLVEQSSKGKTTQRDDEVDTAVINMLIELELADKGYVAARWLIKRYREQGFAFDDWTLSTVAATAVKSADSAQAAIEFMEDLEELTGLRASRQTWSIVIVKVLELRGIKDALAVYQEARDRSVSPDSAMVQPLLDALLLPRASPSNFALAKNIYEDFSTSSNTYTLAPDQNIYVTLLRACADPAAPDLAFSKQLLEDMRVRKVKLDPQAVTWHIVALMRVATSFEDAFAAYDAIRALHIEAFNVNAYNAILAAFTSLSFPALGTAPPPIIREFLGDMRTSGHPPDSFTYSILLSYFSKSGDSSSVSAINHVHSLIKLDSNLDPDTALLNALMGAYARVGAYETAFRIWESMSSTVGITNVSVSIILDTLGFDRRPEAEGRGKRVWKSMLKEDESGGIKLNTKNWDSYVEFLCRHGALQEASRIVFEEMKGAMVQKSTLETLLKFSMSEEGRWEALREKIQVRYPKKWPLVEHVVPRELESQVKATYGVEEQISHGGRF